MCTLPSIAGKQTPVGRGQALNPSATEGHAAVNYPNIDSLIAGSTNAQWKSTVSKMTHIWTIVVLGATLFLSTTVALVLHPYIFDRIYLRLIVIIAFLLSAASGTSASILLAHKERLESPIKKEAWVYASKYPKTFSSINFWVGMSYPLTTLTWAAGLCLVAVLSLAWQTTSVVSCPMSKVNVVVVGVIALLTAMFAFGQVYRVFKLVR